MTLKQKRVVAKVEEKLDAIEGVKNGELLENVRAVSLINYIITICDWMLTVLRAMHRSC